MARLAAPSASGYKASAPTRVPSARRAARAPGSPSPIAVFITSTGGGILSIAKIDGVPLPSFPGPVTRQLTEACWVLHDEPAHRDPVDYA